MHCPYCGIQHSKLVAAVSGAIVYTNYQVVVFDPTYITLLPHGEIRVCTSCHGIYDEGMVSKTTQARVLQALPGSPPPPTQATVPPNNMMPYAVGAGLLSADQDTIVKISCPGCWSSVSQAVDPERKILAAQEIDFGCCSKLTGSVAREAIKRIKAALEKV